MALANHVASDLLPLGNANCLLLPSTSQFLPCATLANQKGVIVYFDANRSAWIGYNLAFGDGGIEEVLAAWEAEAGQSNPMGSFCLGYPTRDGPRAKSRQQMGHFDNLQSCTAAHFDLEVDDFIASDYCNGGLFFFDEEELCLRP
jgi:hypothetical protein